LTDHLAWILITAASIGAATLVSAMWSLFRTYETYLFFKKREKEFTEGYLIIKNMIYRTTMIVLLIVSGISASMFRLVAPDFIITWQIYAVSYSILLSILSLAWIVYQDVRIVLYVDIRSFLEVPLTRQERVDVDDEREIEDIKIDERNSDNV